MAIIRPANKMAAARPQAMRAENKCGMPALAWACAMIWRGYGYEVKLASEAMYEFHVGYPCPYPVAHPAAAREKELCYHKNGIRSKKATRGTRNQEDARNAHRVLFRFTDSRTGIAKGACVV